MRMRWAGSRAPCTRLLCGRGGREGKAHRGGEGGREGEGACVGSGGGWAGSKARVRTYATWNVRTRQVWYIFDADIVTVMEEKNNIVLIVNSSASYT